MQRPPEHPESETHEEHEDDLVNKVYGPSQRDIDRSWDGYETGKSSQKLGGMVWKVTLAVVSIVILASMSLGLLGPLLGGVEDARPPIPEQIRADVLRVIDGRTIVVATDDGERTVRLIGVGSPPFGNPYYDFAQEVTQSWIADKQVLLEADALDADEQGRILRYVFLDNVMINATLILNGLGEAETSQPNTRYDGYLADLERQAREAGVGIWDTSFGSESEVEDAQTWLREPSTAGTSAS